MAIEIACKSSTLLQGSMYDYPWIDAYMTAHDSANATLLSPNLFRVGQRFEASTYYIMREALLFDTPSGELTPGYIWVEGIYFAYIDNNGVKRLKEGSLTGVTGKTPGDISMDDIYRIYVDANGDVRQIEGTLTGLTGKITGQISINTKTRALWTHCFYIDGYGNERCFEGIIQEVVNAKLRLYCLLHEGNVSFDVVVVRGTDLEDPPVKSDYGDLLDETESRGQISSDNCIPDQYVEIILNDTGKGEINRGGIIKFALRSSRDISATPPTGLNEMVAFRCTSETYPIPPEAPTLIVNY